MDADLAQLSAQVGAWLKGRGLRLASAESCTGGWVAQVLTATAGSSEWFERGFVTYSNEAKQESLGVSAQTLAAQGAVSEPVAAEMALGTLAASRAEVALAITGIAGPAGGSPDKPVGTVCFAWVVRGAQPVTRLAHFDGDREAVRRAAVVFALTRLLDSTTLPALNQ
ncbi:MAG: nicotinamide-nucleotide amidase [Sterolibacteriaceae bacterium]|jgi:nicotinamide-nucleotide amidase|nr:nicotinamide-nucleotide amidase [Sterolibacteriaceae bacterium]MBK7662887.1 nicotinamide-nucleotide amidase [Sterolibacteriaceae bacterium]MBK9086999.1 nicotinamide-nucleotide amidase [Sterolibacteriaceae bacterium]